jgi:hypothetical protein
MKIQPINNTSFGIYKGTRKTYYGFVDSGTYKDKNIDIYHAFNEDETLKHKLYYITDNVGKWIKSKLKFFKNDKCYYIARSEQ